MGVSDLESMPSGGASLLSSARASSENLIGMMEPLKTEPEFVGILQISLVVGCVGILAGAGPALAGSAVGLGAVTGAVHLVGGGILNMVPGVGWMGEIIIDRFVHAQSNWTLQPLRSFTEIGAWLYVIFSVQATGQDWQLSVLIGSLWGLPIVLLGELLRHFFDQIHASLSRCLPPNLLKPGVIWLGYFSGVVLAASLSKNDQEGTGRAVVLSVLTGAALISAGQLMLVWRPTRSASLIMQGRILNTGQNWRLVPIRSAVELSSFVGLTCGCYSMTNDSLISLGLSTCAAIAVCICSEHALGAVNDEATRACASVEKPMLLPLAALNFTLFILCVIFSRAQSLAFALVLSAVASVVVCACGRLCLLFPCTLVVGRIIDGRLKNTFHNWEHHPIRSGYELIVWQLCLFASFSYYGRVIPAVQLSCGLGGGNVLINNLLFPIKESDPDHSPRISPKSVPTADPVSLDLNDKSPRVAKKPDEITINQRIVRCVDKTAPMQVGVDGQWIDVKNFAKHHPGGDVIYEFLNRDASAQFYAFHSPSVLSRFKVIGKYDMSATETGKQPAEMAFLSMVKRLDKDGFFGPENAYYARKVALCACLMVCVVAGVWRGHLVLPGALLGMFWMQAGFLTHDLMHNQIFKKRKDDQRHGWFWGNICLGASCVWWRDEHFEHHVFTNTYLKGTGSTDPQQHEAPLWAQDAALRDTTNLFLLRIQHYTFLPIDCGRKNRVGFGIVLHAAWDEGAPWLFAALGVCRSPTADGVAAA